MIPNCRNFRFLAPFLQVSIALARLGKEEAAHSQRSLGLRQHEGPKWEGAAPRHPDPCAAAGMPSRENCRLVGLVPWTSWAASGPRTDGSQRWL